MISLPSLVMPIALAATPAPDTTTAQACELAGDHACAAREYERIARTAAPDRQPLLRYQAHRNWLRAFQRDPQPALLCSAADAVRGPPPPGLASAFTRGRHEADALRREHGITCKTSKPHRRGPLTTRPATNPTTPPDTTPTPTETTPTPAAPTPDSSAASTAPPRPPPADERPARPAPSAPLDVRSPSRTARPWYIAGGVLVGSGLALGAAATAIAVRREHHLQSGAALLTQGEDAGYYTPNQAALDLETREALGDTRRQMLGLGVAAGVASVAAIVMFATGGHRQHRASRNIAWTPTAGGALLVARF